MRRWPHQEASRSAGTCSRVSSLQSERNGHLLSKPPGDGAGGRGDLLQKPGEDEDTE